MPCKFAPCLPVAAFVACAVAASAWLASDAPGFAAPVDDCPPGVPTMATLSLVALVCMWSVAVVASAQTRVVQRETEAIRRRNDAAVSFGTIAGGALALCGTVLAAVVTFAWLVEVGFDGAITACGPAAAGLVIAAPAAWGAHAFVLCLFLCVEWAR